MLSKIPLKLAIPLLFVAAYFGTSMSQMFNPYSDTAAVLVNEAYFRSIHNYFLITGAITGLALGSVGFLTRTGGGVQILVLVFWGVLYTLWGQSAEPEFLDYALSATVEFLVPYLTSALLIIGIIRVIATRTIRNDCDE